MTMKINLRKIFNLIYGLIIAGLIFIAFSVILSSFNTPLRFRLFSVQSGSMEPKIHLGSLVVAQPREKYNAGDAVTFKAEGKTKDTITHRIIKVEEDKDLKKTNYETKGDANEDSDPELIASQRVIGKVILSIPYLGYAVAFAKTQTGLIVLIIVPATLIIYGELINIKNELKKMIKELKEKIANKNKIVENPEIKIVEEKKKGRKKK